MEKILVYAVQIVPLVIALNKRCVMGAMNVKDAYFIVQKVKSVQYIIAVFRYIIILTV